LFVLLFSGLKAQISQFQVAIDSGAQEGLSIVQTKDGGYAVGGIYYNSTTRHDFFIIRFDSIGNIKWAKNIGGLNEDEANCMIQTKDGGFVLAGWTLSFGSGSYDFLVVKLDSVGDLKWTRTIGGKGSEYCYSIVQTWDGGYALSGSTNSYGNGVYVVKLDSVGNLKWTKTIDGGTGWSMIQTKDSGYAITGYTNVYGADAGSGNNVYVIKLDSKGNLSWSKAIGGTKGEMGFSIIQASDGGYAITGSTVSYALGNNSKSDVYLVKLDALGVLKWTRTIGGYNSDVGNSIIQSKDGGYTIAGSTSSYGPGSSDVYVIKLDSVGTLKWTKTVGGTNSDAGLSIIQTKDEGYAVSGISNSYGGVYIIKFDSIGGTCEAVVSDSGMVGSGGGEVNGGVIISSDSGIVSSGGIITDAKATEHMLCRVVASVHDINNSQNKVELYPNPSKGVFAVSVQVVNQKVKFIVYNELGEIINTETLKVSIGDNPIDISCHPSGVYYYRIVSEKGECIANGKFVIAK
jgi:hypothetical protein